MSEMRIGTILINKKGTIARIIDFDVFDNVRIRCVNTTKGVMTDKKGTPYTYQSKTTLSAIEKNWRVMGTEEVLERLWRSENE